MTPSDLLAHYGACVGASNPELWFPRPGGTEADRKHAEAKRICNSCVVRLVCLEWALDTHRYHGIWGGLSEQERRVLKRARTERMVAEWLAGQETVA